MISIEFETTFGDKIKRVQIIWPSGANGMCQILIDKYYQGQLVYQQGKWRHYLNSNTMLTGDDVTALVERIEKLLQSP